MAAEATNARINRCCCFILECAGLTALSHSAWNKAASSRRASKSLHRIVTAGRKRLAAEQTPNPHAGTANDPMLLDRFPRIIGTARHKAARRRQPRRDYSLIELQKRN